MLDWLAGLAELQVADWLQYQSDKDFHEWRRLAHPYASIQAYSKMVAERNHATRLEF